MKRNSVPEVIPTGSLRLDIALGSGGILRGQIVEISGPDSSGKTTLCLHIIAEAQKLGGLCAYLDADHMFDPTYAIHCGVDPDRLFVSEPVDAEQALDMAEILTRSGAITLLVVDSTTGLVPREEIEGRAGPSSQDLMPQALRRLSRTGRETKTAILFTSAPPDRSSSVYHDLTANPSRLALKLHASLRLGLDPVKPIHENREFRGNSVQIRVIKNNFVPTFRTIKLDIMYNEGIRKTGEILDLANELMILTRCGPLYTYQGLLLGEGRAKAIEFLRANSPLSEEIEQAIRQRCLPPARMPVED